MGNRGRQVPQNVVLTAVGIALGCVLGHFLHVWLVKSVEIDMMMFGRDTAPSAYVWAAALTATYILVVSILLWPSTSAR